MNASDDGLCGGGTADHWRTRQRQPLLWHPRERFCPVHKVVRNKVTPISNGEVPDEDHMASVPRYRTSLRTKVAPIGSSEVPNGDHKVTVPQYRIGVTDQFTLSAGRSARRGPQFTASRNLTGNINQVTTIGSSREVSDEDHDQGHAARGAR